MGRQRRKDTEQIHRMRMSGGGRRSMRAVVKEVLTAWELCCTVDFSYSSHKTGTGYQWDHLLFSKTSFLSVCFLHHHGVNLKYTQQILFLLTISWCNHRPSLVVLVLPLRFLELIFHSSVDDSFYIHIL